MALRVSGNGVRQLFGKKEASDVKRADSKGSGSPTNEPKATKSSWAPMSSLSRLAGKATRLAGKASNAIKDFGKSTDWSSSSRPSEELYTAAEREEAEYYGYSPVHHEPPKRSNAGSEQVSLPYSPPAMSVRMRPMTDEEQKAEVERADHHNERPSSMIEEYYPSPSTRTSQAATNSRSGATSKAQPEIWRDMNPAEMEAEDARARHYNEIANYGKVLDHEAMAQAAQSQKPRTRPPTMEEVRASVRQQTQKADPQKSQKPRTRPPTMEEVRASVRQQTQKADPQNRPPRASDARGDAPKASNQPARRPFADRTNEAPGTRPSTRSNAAELAKFRGLLKDIEKEVGLVMKYANDLKAQRREARTPNEKAQLSAKLAEVNTQGKALLELRDQANEKIAELTGKERT